MWNIETNAQAGLIDLSDDDTRQIFGGTRGGDADLDSDFDANDFNYFDSEPAYGPIIKIKPKSG